MTKSILTILLLLVIVARPVEASVSYAIPIDFPDAELQHSKRVAIRAINSAAAWQNFPKNEHARRYTVIRQKISYSFHVDRPNEVTIILPTTKTTPRHQCYVAVTLDHFGKIVDMYESFFL